MPNGNAEAIRGLLPHLGSANDLVIQEARNGAFSLEYFYLQPLCDVDRIRQVLLEPFLRASDTSGFLCSLEVYTAEKTEPGKLEAALLQGRVAIRISGGEAIYTLHVANKRNEMPKEIRIEPTIYGPDNGFSDDITRNLESLRNRYPSSPLQVRQRILGKKSRTMIALVYDGDRVNKKVLEQLEQKLGAIQVDVLQSVGQLQRLLVGRRSSILPNMLITERPDRAVLNVAQGKVLVLMDGVPFVLIAPVVFYDFMSSMDDVYESYWIALSLTILRYISLVIATTLPAMYISIVSYNPEVFRIQFTFSLAGSRAAVPYPSFVEVMIMLFMIEALTEASIRLPRSIGSTATTVGGLILGQAAQQAGLVSSIMIIVTSAVAISNYVVPISMMTFSIRLLKYPYIVLATLFGMVGVFVGIFMTIVYAAGLRSFGEPYFRLFLNERSTSGIKGAGRSR